MKAPLYPLGIIGEEAGFIAIFFLGLFFSASSPERAGFGSSRKLTSIFYFKDWSVLRVMFTAIVVAMLGLLYLTGIGWMDGDAVTVKETILGPDRRRPPARCGLHHRRLLPRHLRRRRGLRQAGCLRLHRRHVRRHVPVHLPL